jgi:hypothetical protein
MCLTPGFPPGSGPDFLPTGFCFFPAYVVAFLLSFSFCLILSCVYQMKNWFLPMEHLCFEFLQLNDLNG